MGGLFSSSKASSKTPVVEKRGKGGEITEKDRAMLELKSARNKIVKYRKQVVDLSRMVAS
jgi:hypothetical protein